MVLYYRCLLPYFSGNRLFSEDVDVGALPIFPIGNFRRRVVNQNANDKNCQAGLSTGQIVRGDQPVGCQFVSAHDRRIFSIHDGNRVFSFYAVGNFLV